MDCRTGEICQISDEDMKDFMQVKERYFNEERKMVSLSKEEVKNIKNLDLPKRKGWMRNQPCVCDSGKKFKKCCWHKFKD